MRRQEGSTSSRADRYRWAKIRIPEFRGGDKWSSYLVQFRTIMKMHGCSDNDVMVFNLVEALRGPALEYYNSLPAETCGQLSTLFTLFEGRFGRQEPPATTRSNLKTIIQRVDEPLPEFAERTLRMAADGYSGMGGMDPSVGGGHAFLMGCTDKRSARLALDRDPKTVDEAVSLMRRFHGHEKELFVERRMRTLALEEGDPVAPQVNRVQEERSSSLDIGELNENIEKFTKLLANINMAGPGRRMGHVKCFIVGKLGTLPAIVDQMCRGPTPGREMGHMSKPHRKKTLRTAGEQPVAVKLDKEYGCVIDDVVEMREVMVRTGSDRCTLVIDMTINNHYVEAVVDSGAQVSVLSRRFYDSLSCRPKPVEFRLLGLW